MQRDSSSISLKTIRMLVVADGANPCELHACGRLVVFVPNNQRKTGNTRYPKPGIFKRSRKTSRGEVCKLLDAMFAGLGICFYFCILLRMALSSIRGL